MCQTILIIYEARGFTYDIMTAPSQPQTTKTAIIFKFPSPPSKREVHLNPPANPERMPLVWVSLESFNCHMIKTLLQTLSHMTKKIKPGLNCIKILRSDSFICKTNINPT